MIQLLVARGSRPTGRVLADLLRERGLALGGGNPQAVVSYGVRYGGKLPALNARVGGRNKFQELEALSGAGVRTVPFSRALQALRPPVLSRRFHHHAGRDIRYCRDFAAARLATQDFFTQIVPSRTEFRVFVYRRRHLGSYEKVKVRRFGTKRFGRSYRNGYAFQLVPAERLNRESIDLACRAVEALGLDFGAVDVLLGTDGHCYVLEVNSAPGVEGPGRQVIQALADKIANWVKLNFPKRKGDNGE